MKTPKRPVVIATIFLISLVGIPFIVPDNIGDKISKAVNIITPFAALLLVWLTYRYLIATKSMVDEMRTARESEYRPLIVVDIESHMDTLDIVVMNCGRGVAKDVKFHFDPMPLDYEANPVDAAKYLSAGINIFPPNKTVKLLYGFIQGMTKADSFATKAFKVTTEYSDTSGKSQPQYVFDFDLDSCLKSTPSMQGGTTESHLSSIASSLKRMESSGGSCLQ